MIGDQLWALARYLWWTVTTGDYANDWLTHLATPLRLLIEFLLGWDPTIKTAERGWWWLAMLLAHAQAWLAGWS